MPESASTEKLTRKIQQLESTALPQAANTAAANRLQLDTRGVNP